MKVVLCLHSMHSMGSSDLGILSSLRRLFVFPHGRNLAALPRFSVREDAE